MYTIRFIDPENEKHCDLRGFQKWKNRSISGLFLCGRNPSSPSQFVNPFKIKLNAKIEDLGLSNDQLYNTRTDESGLYWKLLPQKTYVTSLKKSAPGAKMGNQSIIFLCCANASGSHKITILVIEKSKKPAVLKILSVL